VARWAPDASGRLVQAALELFDERGYERTTVAAIAERAGVTERTFFRWFVDKREVLFPANGLQEHLAGAVAEAPAAQAPLDAVETGLAAVATGFFGDRLEHARRRTAVVEANEELRERELLKLAAMAVAVAAALRDRGVPEPAATITAETGIALFKVAFAGWVDPADDRPLAELVAGSFDHLRAAASASAGAPAS